MNLEKENLDFSPVKFCYLRDTLNDLSKLDEFRKRFAYIPIDEYVTQLDELIKYFEDNGLLDKIMDFPCKSCDAIYESEKEAITCDNHHWNMHGFMAIDVRRGHQK